MRLRLFDQRQILSKESMRSLCHSLRTEGLLAAIYGRVHINPCLLVVIGGYLGHCGSNGKGVPRLNPTTHFNPYQPLSHYNSVGSDLHDAGKWHGRNVAWPFSATLVSHVLHSQRSENQKALRFRHSNRFIRVDKIARHTAYPPRQGVFHNKLEGCQRCEYPFRQR